MNTPVVAGTVAVLYILLISGTSGAPVPLPWDPYSDTDLDSGFKGAKGFGELGWGGIQMAMPMMQKMFKDKKEEWETKYFPKKVIKAHTTSDSSEEIDKAKKLRQLVAVKAPEHPPSPTSVDGTSAQSPPPVP